MKIYFLLLKSEFKINKNNYNFILIYFFPPLYKIEAVI